MNMKKNPMQFDSKENLSMSHRYAALTLLFALSATLATGQPLAAFSYDNTASAQQHWTPVFGSRPVRVEKAEDGTACIALDAEFTKVGDRACWDWTTSVDLSQIGNVSFEVQATDGGLAGNIGVYFGTPNGWYTTFWRRGVPDAWTPRTFRLDTFDTEGKPDGWAKVTTFRFSIWSAGIGKTTCRLRNFRAHPIDPAENFVVNGSFEIPSPGVPYGWGDGHWGVGAMPWAANMDLWRKHWHLDSQVAKHGKTSLCIENTPDLPLLMAHSVWLKMPKTVKSYTLSAWVKSDRSALDVMLQCAGQSMIATIGDTWRQVVLKEVPWQSNMTVVIAPQKQGKLWIDAVQIQSCALPTAAFRAAVRDEGIAAREALVDWSMPRRATTVAAERSVSGPMTKGTVSIDEHGRFLLNGKPYIQHSFGLEFVSDLNVLNAVAKAGFKDVCIQIRESLTAAQLKAIFDRCAMIGLRIIPWLDGRMSRERFTKHITTLKEHPALLCWYVYDEPSGERFAEADARVKLAKSLDPGHPALINYLGDRLENQTGDIYSTDIYPIPHVAPNAAISGVRRMKAAAAAENKPVWMWLQGTGYAYWMDREPSPRELSCMAYGSLICGARGIYYFAQFPRTSECFAEMRALCVEVDALTPVLSGIEAGPRTICNKPAVLIGTYSLDGVPWILAVNTQAISCQARFEIENTPKGRVEVMFEARNIGITDATWEDAFGPYERHVYRLPPVFTAAQEPLGNR